MKRCPLCDFIYEDDQNFCDMDGLELVGDRGALITTTPADEGPVKPVRSPRMRFSVPLLVGVVLGAAFLSAFYSSTDSAAPANTDASRASAAGPQAPAHGQVLTVVPPAATPTPSPAATPMNDHAAMETADPPARQPPAPPKSRSAGAKERRSQPSSGDNKKESKLGSFLSKTGRMLKKPFKF
jgi:hypothetical protein